ncbi:hypothetical protein JHK82_037234 [Glycine max]|nr:hypothetical protein JHK82_037234 [Glycine max]
MDFKKLRDLDGGKMAYAADALTPTSSINDGQELISAGQNFSLGFFTPGISKSRYVGIWYKNIMPQTVVWVANRDYPLNDSSGNLTIVAGNIDMVYKFIKIINSRTNGKTAGFWKFSLDGWKEQ